jgi:hypothetical protein
MAPSCQGVGRASKSHIIIVRRVGLALRHPAKAARAEEVEIGVGLGSAALGFAKANPCSLVCVIVIMLLQRLGVIGIVLILVCPL